MSLRPRLRLRVPVLCLVGLATTAACSGGGNTCGELRDFYADNPGDSNRSIARDYFRLCDELPPPVISGELDVEDVR